MVFPGYRCCLKALALMLGAAFQQLSISMSMGEGLHYLSFQDNGQAIAESWAMWGCPPPLSDFAINTNLERKCLNNSLNEANLTSFSVCYFLKMTSIRPHNIAFSFFSSNLSFQVGHAKDSSMITDTDDILIINFSTDFLTWASYCVVFNEGKTISLYKDGSLLDDLEFKQRRKLSFNDFFILGQSLTGLPKSSLAGELADFQIWTEALTDDKVERIAACETVNPPPRVFLNRDEWLVNGTTVWVTNSAVENVCELKPFTNRSLIPMGEYFWNESLELCQTVGGRLPTPMDNISNILLKNVVTHHHISTKGICLGISRSLTGWTDTYTGQLITFWPQRALVQGKQTNVYLDPKTNTWLENENSQCLAICEIPIHKVFLKGLCAASEFSKELWVHQSVSGRLVLREPGTFILQANEQMDEWSLSSSSYQSTWAIVKTKPSELPFGKQSWTVWDKVCGHNGETMSLMLTACPKDEFTCDDLSCIPVEWVCNGRMDCSDRSDEDCFNRTLMPPHYDKIPPMPDPTSPMNVVCSVEVINYESFSIKEMTSVVHLKMALQWRDNRLKFLYLQEDSAPVSHLVDVIWTPRFDMTSDLGLMAKTDVIDRFLAVRREGLAEPDDLSSLNGGVFLGSSATLELTLWLVVTATCDPDLYKFPFDSQTCKLFIKVKSSIGSIVTSGNLTTNHVFRERLLEYYVRNMTLGIEKLKTREENWNVVFITQFGHLYGYYSISIFMPTLLLVIVSYGSFYFEQDDFTDRIMVSLTSLLVLSTFISTASSSMARVSYFTFLDIWLSFCIVLVFIICLLHTFLLSLGRRGNGGEKKKTEQQWAKVTPGNIMLGIRETPDKSQDASPCRRLADMTIKICLPVLIVSFTIVFFYLGLQD